jgi:hypothetical protein
VIEPVRLLKHAIDARRADGYHVVVEYHEGQAAIPLRMTVVEIDNSLFFPVLEPLVVGDFAVVLVDFAVTVLPVVELARAQTKPSPKPTPWKLRVVGLMLDVVDTRVSCGTQTRFRAPQVLFLGVFGRICGLENDGASRLGLDRRVLPPTFTFAPPC